MSLRLITAPATYPVTLANAKLQCSVDSTDFDTLLTTYISAATAYVESYTGRGLVTQTWELVLDDFSTAIMLPKGPVQSVTSVTYYDTASVLQTVATSVYSLDNVSDPAWIVLKDGQSWPSVAVGVNNVIIRFIVGYTALPADIHHAMLLLIGHWLANREAGGPTDMIPHGVDALLSNHRSFAIDS